MKANELMIGDWVRVPSELNREKQIRSTFDMDSAVLYEAIPLTAEILEKNGFICNIHNIYELSVNTDTFNNLISYQPNYGGIYICKETSEGDFLSEIQLKLQYVHELQHAMNLFKIEKEIVL